MYRYVPVPLFLWMRQNFEKLLVIVRYCSVSGPDDETRIVFYRSKNLKNWFYALLSISRIVSLCFISVYRIVPVSDTNWYGSGGGWSVMIRFIIRVSDRVIHAVPVITGQATFETGLHTLTGAIVRFLHNRRWSPGWHKTLWFSMTFPFFIVADNYGWVISPCRLRYALWRQEWWQYTWSFLQGTNTSPHSIHTFLSAFLPLAHTEASAAVFLSVPLVIQGPGRSHAITRSYWRVSK